jgi:hypothetical protein
MSRSKLFSNPPDLGATVLQRRPQLAPSSLLRPLLDAVPLLLAASPGRGASTCSRHRKLRRGVRPEARVGTGQEAGRPCGPGSRTPASSPPRLSSMRGATSTWSSSELDQERARRTVVRALLDAGARPLLLPAVDLGLHLDGGGRRSARRYGRRRTGSGASPVVQKVIAQEEAWSDAGAACCRLPRQNRRCQRGEAFCSFFFLLGLVLGSPIDFSSQLLSN